MSVRRTFVDFEDIRITAPYNTDNGGRNGPDDWQIEEKQRDDYIKALDERLSPWLGTTVCTSIGDGDTGQDSGSVLESILFLKFLSRDNFVMILDTSRV